MKELIKLINEFHRTHRFWYYSSIFFIVSIPATNIIMPMQFKKLYDEKNYETYGPILKVTLIVIFLMIIIQLNFLLSRYQYVRLTNFIHKICNKNILQNKKFTSGDKSISKIVLDTHKIEDIVSEIYYEMKSNLLPGTMFVLLTIGYFFYVDYRLGLLLIGTQIIEYIISRTSISSCGELSEKTRVQNLKINNKIEDVVSNITTVNIENKKKYEEENINKELDKNKDYKDKFVTCYSQKSYYILGLSFIFTISTVLLCFKLKQEGKISATSIATIFFILQQMISYKRKSSKFIRIYSSHYAALNKLKWLINIDPIKEIKPEKFNYINIKVNNLSYKYPGTDKYILKNINFEINNKDKILIKGSIGTGKSTLTKILIGHIQDFEGEIIINGKPYKENIYGLQTNIGYMTQNPKLFNTTIIENIKYVNKNISEEEIIKIINDLGVYDTLLSTKEGLYREVGKDGSMLSGGQKQIIAFIRMYIKNPELVVLDEPNSSLDKDLSKKLENLLKEFIKEKTVIIISHNNFLNSSYNKTINL